MDPAAEYLKLAIESNEPLQLKLLALLEKAYPGRENEYQRLRGAKALVHGLITFSIKWIDVETLNSISDCNLSQSIGRIVTKCDHEASTHAEVLKKLAQAIATTERDTQAIQDLTIRAERLITSTELQGGIPNTAVTEELGKPITSIESRARLVENAKKRWIATLREMQVRGLWVKAWDIYLGKTLIWADLLTWFEEVTKYMGILGNKAHEKKLKSDWDVSWVNLDPELRRQIAEAFAWKVII